MSDDHQRQTTEHEVAQEIGDAVAHARVYRMGSWVYLGVRIDMSNCTEDSPYDLARKVASILPEEKLGKGAWEEVSWDREVELGLGGDNPTVYKTPGRHVVCFIRQPLLRLALVEPDTEDEG